MLARKKPLRSSRSTTTPTREEADRIERCKSGVCVACAIWADHPDSPPGFIGAWGGDYHHLLSGGRRRGHMFGVCLCKWHHVGIIADDWHSFGMTHAEMRRHYGPSLMDGSKTFRDTYGSDDVLLAKQDELLGGTA